jgi:hypothetical protein
MDATPHGLSSKSPWLLLFCRTLLSPSPFLLETGEFLLSGDTALRSPSSGKLRFLSRPDGDIAADAVGVACFCPGGIRGPACVPATGEPVVELLTSGYSTWSNLFEEVPSLFVDDWEECNKRK